MRKNEWIDFAIALLAGAVFVCIASANEPPQCNLPDWPTVKESLTVHADPCPCGVACPCADVFTVSLKAPKAAKAPAPPQQPKKTIEKRYVRKGRKLVAQDFIVEAGQPTSAAYVPPPQAVRQGPRMDCSSGTCRYVR